MHGLDSPSDGSPHIKDYIIEQILDKRVYFMPKLRVIYTRIQILQTPLKKMLWHTRCICIVVLHSQIDCLQSLSVVILHSALGWLGSSRQPVTGCWRVRYLWIKLQSKLFLLVLVQPPSHRNQWHQLLRFRSRWLLKKEYPDLWLVALSDGNYKLSL